MQKKWKQIKSHLRVAFHKDVKSKDFVISQNDWIVGKFKPYGGIKNDKINL